MKKIVYIIFFVLTAPLLALAQTVVTGVVKDVNGPLAGVTVSEKGGKNATATKGNGSFSLNVRGGGVLIFKSVGYVAQERKAKPGERLEVVMQASTQDMQEVVVVAYGTTKRITNTGSVSSVKGSEIRNVPTSSVQNALQGRLPGFISVQRSGQPGRDASDFFIRGVSSLNPDGNQPLIIVDDIEYTYEQLSQINVNEIESISILKDASTTAVYGIKGANGVLVVKTRRGNSGTPKVNLRLETGLQSPVSKLKFLNAFETATLVNEARVNDGLAPQFSNQDLEHFRLGDDPYGHPDVNWYKKIFKPISQQYNSNIDISGGSDAIKYFVSGGAFTQNGNLNKFQSDENLVNNNYYYRRYNLRSNLDVQATKTLKLRLDLRAGFNKINSPRAGNIVSEIFDFNKIHPYSAPFLNPNGSFAYATDTKDLLPTINSRLATNGYTLERRNDLNILFGGTQDLKSITSGLSVTGQIAYASVESNSREQARNNPPSYYYNPGTNSYLVKGTTYTYENYQLFANQGLYNNRVNVQGRINYNKTFGNHTVSSLLLYNRESYKTRDNDSKANWIPQNFQGVTWRTSYDYKERFLLDFTAAYNGSDRFNADHRFGWFPAVSVGYNIAKENFIKENFKFIDLLKLRGSYGIVGSDRVQGDRYLYQQVYNRGGGYSLGETHRPVNTITEGNLGNSNVTWEKQKSLDIGLDGNLFNSRLNFQIDYFNNLRYDQLFSSQSLPLSLGIGNSPTNIARVRNHGFDGELGFNGSVGKFNYNVKGVFTYAKNKVLYRDEPSPAYPWLAQTGRPIGQQFGYTFIGFYKDAQDIANSAKPNTGSPIVPGDLKYKDLNGDNVIDQFDMGAIGKPNIPSTSFGLTLGGSYKGFSISVLLQGTTGYSFSVYGTGIEPFQSQFQPIHEQRWTPQTAETAKFPRLSTNPTTINSPGTYLSDFWLINATYLRLKTVELGYVIPSKWLPFKLSNARLYLSGYNILTWTNYSLYQQDPEVTSNTAGDAYQNQRVVNLGLQIGF
jgi:TonB-linked SusC/RagA family outer membrane protein